MSENIQEIIFLNQYVRKLITNIWENIRKYCHILETVTNIVENISSISKKFRKKEMLLKIQCFRIYEPYFRKYLQYFRKLLIFPEILVIFSIFSALHIFSSIWLIYVLQIFQVLSEIWLVFSETFCSVSVLSLSVKK